MTVKQYLQEEQIPRPPLTHPLVLGPHALCRPRLADITLVSLCLVGARLDVAAVLRLCLKKAVRPQLVLFIEHAWQIKLRGLALFQQGKATFAWHKDIC